MNLCKVSYGVKICTVIHLHKIYSQRAKFVIIFVSKEYKEKIWTDPERQAAQERALREMSKDGLQQIINCDEEIKNRKMKTSSLQILD